jgi:hypothetical protein
MNPSPEAVKYLVAVLWADEDALPDAYEQMIAQWGVIEFSGLDRLFDLTDYYEPEMGANLYRRLVAFETLRCPGELADVKAAGQKIYLANGIYADLVARYADGRYQPFSWTFPDFKDGRYDEELGLLRKAYLAQIKSWRSHTADRSLENH